MNELYAGHDLMIALIKNDLIHTQLMMRLKIDDNRYKDYEPQSDEILMNFMFLCDGADRSHVLKRYREFKAEMPIVSHENRLKQFEEIATNLYNDLVS